MVASLFQAAINLTPANVEGPGVPMRSGRFVLLYKGMPKFAKRLNGWGGVN